jgi:hypothetical protein
MTVVVIVGLLMGMIVGGVRLSRRREDLADRAWNHAMRTNECEVIKHNAEQWLIIDTLFNELSNLKRSTGGPDAPWADKAHRDRAKAARPQILEQVALMERAIAYHAAMQRKYEDAARRPWLPVEPDPPEPR